MVTIFTRQITGNLTSLVKKIDATAAKNQDKKMAAFVVYLTDDSAAAESELTALAKKHGIKHTPLTVFKGTEGPSTYKVSKDAEVTIMMWSKFQVKANHAFAKGKLNKAAIGKVLKDTAKILK